MSKRLYRSRDRKLGGVCGGIAEYLGTDPTVIRLIWVLLSLLYGSGLIVYLVCWIVIPEYPS
ncbi:MAG TPA: PspC domain-containing protein [Firmicutes bacterium]|jgi:phage shock protein PspC (stress-responsive transcriptional regulator)|nr:PspC domain-containing protein [Bacillota bacterium]